MTSNTCHAHCTAATLDGELTIARQARAEGDPAHALHHFVNVLAIEPRHVETTAALREIAQEIDVPAKLANSDYYGAHIARAYLLAERGELEVASEILAQVLSQLPHLEVADVLVGWVERLETVTDALTGRLAHLLSCMSLSVGLGRVHLFPGERAAILPYVPLARVIVNRTRDPMFLALASGVLRRAGELDEAIDVAKRAITAQETPPSLSALGLALRAAGRPQEAAHIFAKAYAMEPDAAQACEYARALAEAGELDRALLVVRSVDMDPDVETRELIAWIEGRAAGDATQCARTYDEVRRRAIAQHSVPRMVMAGDTLERATPAPSPEIERAIAAMIREPYDLFEWWRRAEVIARELPNRARELADAMLHPTSPAAGWAAHDWAYAWQVACALLIARGDIAWRGSDRREVLRELVRGPQDWRSAAAALVLAEIAVHDADSTREVRRELMDLFERVLARESSCLDLTLVFAGDRVPLFPQHLLTPLTERGGTQLDAYAFAAAPRADIDRGQAPSKDKKWWAFWRKRSDRH